MKKLLTRYLLLLIAIGVIAACSDDPDPVLDSPSIYNLEIGSGDNGIGVIGKDFHFEADVTAGERIDTVEILIRQKAGQTYSGEWSLSLIWDQYKGLKNTNIHRHFDIPEDAVAGLYDFVVRVLDENGTVTEVIRDINLVDED